MDPAGADRHPRPELPLCPGAPAGEDGVVTIRMAALVALLGVGLVLAACGSGETASPGQSPGNTSSPADTGNPTPTAPPGGGSPMTLRGTVSEGVEAGCLVFTAENGGTDVTWTLLGETSDLRPGATVTLRGTPRSDMATICQQGQPFWVTEVLER